MKSIFTIGTLCLVLMAFSEPVTAQNDSTAPRSTTERPNVSAPGLEQTITGVLMSADCSAIADARSELTRTPRLVPKNSEAGDSARRGTPRATERARTETASDSAVPERYRDCNLKSSSTSFAVYSAGKVYMLDRISNQMMQENLENSKSGTASSNSQWKMRTVVGTVTSDEVITIRKIR